MGDGSDKKLHFFPRATPSLSASNLYNTLNKLRVNCYYFIFNYPMFSSKNTCGNLSETDLMTDIFQLFKQTPKAK